VEVYCILCGYMHECRLVSEGGSRNLYWCEDKRDYFILEKEMLNGEG
jgi:hypothetical protein